MTPEFRAALTRAVLSAFVTGGATFFTLVATTDLRASLIGTGAAVFATLGARFGGEGWFDSKRANPA